MRENNICLFVIGLINLIWLSTVVSIFWKWYNFILYSLKKHCTYKPHLECSLEILLQTRKNTDWHWLGRNMKEAQGSEKGRLGAHWQQLLALIRTKYNTLYFHLVLTRGNEPTIWVTILKATKEHMTCVWLLILVSTLLRTGCYRWIISHQILRCGSPFLVIMETSGKNQTPNSPQFSLHFLFVTLLCPTPTTMLSMFWCVWG